jgi:hypothetical protein
MIELWACKQTEKFEVIKKFGSTGSTSQSSIPWNSTTQGPAQVHFG